MNNFNQFFRELPGLLREPLPVLFADLFGVVNSFIYLFFRELPAVPLLRTPFRESQRIVYRFSFVNYTLNLFYRELPRGPFPSDLLNLFPFVNYSAFQLGNAAGPGP